MKQKYFITNLLIFLSVFSFSQSAGDIAFVGFNTDGNKDFAIVVLADITNKTIYFTDDETTGSAGVSGLAGSEGTITWTTGINTIKAGTIVVFTDVDSDSNPAFGASIGSITRSGAFNLSGSKDGIIAFIGTDSSTPTTYIAAIQIGNDNAHLGPFDGDAITLTNTGLVIGTSIIIADNTASPDGGNFKGSRSNQTSFSDYYAQINTNANWDTESTNGELSLPFSQEAFTINTTTWTGASSNVWTLPGNWNNGVPTSNSLVTIPEVATAPEITTAINAEVGNLSISDTDGISILKGTLTINGNLTINSGSQLYLESAFTGANTIDAASVILNGSYTSADSNKFFYFTETFNDNTSGWTLISSPTIGEVIDGGATGFATFNALQTSGTNYGIAPYDNSVISANRWDYYTTTEIAATNTLTMTSGKGYSVLPNSALNSDTAKGNLGFKGSLPTSDITIAITDNSGGVGNDFNLIGNPYPSFIPADNTADATNAFLNKNTAELSEATLWFWNKATSAYITVNQTSNRFIAPAQGFFVKSKTGGGTITFTKAMQSHQSSGTFNKTPNNRPEINLIMTSGNSKKNTLIYFYENKTTGFDNGYDSSMFNGVSNSLAIYSQLVSNNQGKDLAIQTLPDSNYENMVIPIGINATSGKEITFSSETINLPSGIKVYLEDKDNNTLTRLDEVNSEYKITLNTNLNGIGRFYLHTRSNSTLNTSNFDIKNIDIFKNSLNTLRITGLQNGNATIKMFDVLGKKVHTTFFKANTINDINLPALKTGIYIVQLITTQGKISKKIIIE